MALRDDILSIHADGLGDKRGREERLRVVHLRDRVAAALPFVWQPRAGLTVTVKAVQASGNVVSLMVDVTIRGVTKSLSEWIEGSHSVPDLRIVNPPLFVDDPTGDVELTMIGEDGVTKRRGRDDMLAAMKQTVREVIEARIADARR